MHFEIILPLGYQPQKGFKLPGGHMQRLSKGGKASLYKPLSYKDELIDRQGKLNLAAMRSVMRSDFPANTIFAIYDDYTDPFLSIVDVKINEIERYIFDVNKAYRVLL